MFCEKSGVKRHLWVFVCICEIVCLIWLFEIDLKWTLSRQASNSLSLNMIGGKLLTSLSTKCTVLRVRTCLFYAKWEESSLVNPPEMVFMCPLNGKSLLLVLHRLLFSDDSLLHSVSWFAFMELCVRLHQRGGLASRRSFFTNYLGWSTLMSYMILSLNVKHSYMVLPKFLW